MERTAAAAVFPLLHSHTFRFFFQLFWHLKPGNLTIFLTFFYFYFFAKCSEAPSAGVGQQPSSLAVMLSRLVAFSAARSESRDATALATPTPTHYGCTWLTPPLPPQPPPRDAHARHHAKLRPFPSFPPSVAHGSTSLGSSPFSTSPLSLPPSIYRNTTHKTLLTLSLSHTHTLMPRVAV